MMGEQGADGKHHQLSTQRVVGLRWGWGWDLQRVVGMPWGWGWDVPRWDLDLPRWDLDLQRWDLDLQRWDLDLQRWDLDLQRTASVETASRTVLVTTSISMGVSAIRSKAPSEKRPWVAKQKTRAAPRV